MIRYLLDTNILSALCKDPSGSVRVRLDQEAFRSNIVYTTVIVAAELRFGLAKGGSVRTVQRVERLLTEILIVPFTEPADRYYAVIRAELERKGIPIGGNDLWIAAQALHDDSVLVTDNVKEFGRVPKLKIENWLRA